jgi:hypothetical protein
MVNTTPGQTPPTDEDAKDAEKSEAEGDEEKAEGEGDQAAEAPQAPETPAA